MSMSTDRTSPYAVQLSSLFAHLRGPVAERHVPELLEHCYGERLKTPPHGRFQGSVERYLSRRSTPDEGVQVVFDAAAGKDAPVRALALGGAVEMRSALIRWCRRTLHAARGLETPSSEVRNDAPDTRARYALRHLPRHLLDDGRPPPPLRWPTATSSVDASSRFAEGGRAADGLGLARVEAARHP